jgi:GT2 family glycosyltransferase
MNFDIVVSIVLYKNNPVTLSKTIKSALESDRIRLKLYLIDNSPSDDLRIIISDPRCIYIFNKKNPGFGAGHNIALRDSLNESRYHLILNPDVYFGPDVLNHLYDFLERNSSVGLLMPRILFPDGTFQYSGKLLPAPWDLIGRRTLSWLPSFKKRDFDYELRGADYTKIMNIPQLLGCFLLFRRDVLSKTGLFDEHLFMYMEDVDITRRIYKHYDTIYYPGVQIYHHYEKGSRKNFRLFFHHAKSAFIYFNKWGWFSDRDRKSINQIVLGKYQTSHKQAG